MRARLLVPLLVAAGLVAGCASVPASSAPRVVAKIDPAHAPADAAVLRDSRPGAGASESEVASGFIRALQSWQGGHEPARRFLTERASSAWKDDEEIVIAESAPRVGVPDSDHVVPVTFTPIGTVARDGSYLPAFGEAAKPVTWRLGMTLVGPDGEWRIGKLPADGVVLSRSQFEQGYLAYSVYFLDPSGGRLVPDRRYLPNDPANLVGRLVRKLIDGPSEWLAPVVSNDLALPVALNRVDMVRQVVDIDLAGLNAQVSEVRTGAVAQLVYTLNQLTTSVLSVKVTSDGQPVDLRELRHGGLTSTDLPRYDPEALPDSQVPPTSQPDTQPGGGTPTHTPDPAANRLAAVQPYYQRGGAVYALDGTRVVDGRYGLSTVGVSTDLQQLAGVGAAPSGGKQTLWLGPLKGSLRASKLRADTLSRPTWDRATGTFWTVADGRRIVSVSLDGQVRPIGLATTWLGRPVGPIGALRLGRDGTRVAFAAGPALHQVLYVGRVHSESAGVTIENPIPITPAISDVRDLAWESSTNLVVLGATVGGPVAPWRVQVDGSSAAPSRMLPVPPGTVTITAAPDSAPVVSNVAEGGTLSLLQTTWGDPPGKGEVHGSAPTYPG
jgi:hypothetical protein